MTKGYFKPWTSDEGPKVPQGWGLTTYRGKVDLTCMGCGKKLLVYHDEYLYNFTPEGTEIYHNTDECFNG